MQAHFSFFGYEVVTMPNDKGQRSTGRYANYNDVASRIAAIHEHHPDRVSIQTTKPVFSQHEILGSIVECQAVVTIYPDDIELPDQLDYYGHAQETLGTQAGTAARNYESLYEICETSAIGRALASAGYLGKNDEGKMVISTEESKTSAILREELKKVRQELEEANKAVTQEAKLLREELEKKKLVAIRTIADLEAQQEAETASITVPEGDQALTQALWKSWLEATGIPANTFSAINGGEQKIESIAKLGQIFQTYQQKAAMTPQILKSQLVTVFGVENPRLLTDDQADQLIADMEKA